MRLNAIYRPVIAAALRTAAWGLQRIPRRLALALGDMLGAAAYRLKRRDRALAMDHLTQAFGRSKSRKELARIARASARNVCRSFVETLRLPAMTEDEIASLVDADPLEPAERVLARGKGLLVLTAHVGAWEMLGGYLAMRLGKPLYAIGRRLYFEPYNELLVSIRRSRCVETVFQDEGPRPLLRILRRNRALALLADQDVPRLHGVFVDFFGRPAYTPTGPAALARASGAGIVPVLITWRGGHHKLHVLPEVELVKTHDRRADTMDNTRRWSRVIEDFIRRHPENWVWFHRRWRTRPEDVGQGESPAGGGAPGS